MKTTIRPLVNLNTNPCKMCMPLGAVTALYGIHGCMSILHGSQGCSTYIRRHMATHYNEPVDIASSSLTENGTIYGGEVNLKKGLKNLIDIYRPSVVGVPTTCLAETIGEDVPRIINNFYDENPEYKDVVIIPVNSAGYGGTQFEGYFKALYHIVSRLSMESKPNKKINVITSYISAADTRFLKEVFSLFGLDIILLPDLSDNLDGGFKENYNKLPEGGTPIEEIRKMAGAAVTLELCNMELTESPGKYLEQEYGVPYKRLNLPTGLRDTDFFYEELARLSGREIPEEIKKQRSRYLDSMIDSHKYNSEGRAVVFGEPDQIISIVRLCRENGIVPISVATGSTCPNLARYVEREIQKVAENYLISDYEIKDDTDFKEIESMAVSHKANILIGNSDGRRIEHSLGIPLIRRGFPIHDRVGGQRLRLLGYEGTLTLLDEITNAILSRKETGFREEVYNKYYKGTEIDTNTVQAPDKGKIAAEFILDRRREELHKKTESHPCYNCAAHKYARIHLPVAPRCNVQCNYCVRKFDCPNESRPGVTTSVLTPEEAFLRYKKVKEKMQNLTVVGIAGPGDALANWEETKHTLELIRKYDEKVTFCLSTNGLMLPAYAEELVKLRVSHITVTINAVDPHIAGQIYKYIYYMGKRYEGDAAGGIMVSNQLNGLRILIAHGVVCKVNIVTLKGINDTHIPEIVQTVKDIGGFITNIMPHISVEGSVFEKLPKLNEKELEQIRQQCSGILKQMYHCKQCRADAVGTLDEDKSIDIYGFQDNESLSKANKNYRFAVASKNGSLVDLHFGHAKEFYIYEYKDGEANLLEIRSVDKYCGGNSECQEESDKIERMITSVKDCHGVLSMRIGENPKNKLREHGIKVITTYDRVTDAVVKAAENY
ncbi:nitrogenase cofactor biosynthesis protein NifB [Anaerocolumna sp. MB42-C2]|uniref:nitrogenase cofactor biosynthesis protein NifB n=1 Tax=Anaerocolumna sp. MB42-C2 TaxID=3070997 RepID=UPI0027DF94ED|nr:nitrogenase cofactor biosynthesis protein NifB [Anaerocolumna sp. MB42-C2]WMJ88824.1 nitrogenase cofactor biosynthesis protein NifB [Anaerocolumna sp. MB42-C2]